jgi:hypothetical protein
MRISARQLRQIIREELHRGMSEADGDETAAGMAKMPGEPKKRGFLDKVFGPSEESLAWSAGWSKLSQGEKDVFIAGVKKDPEYPTIAGNAVRNKDFNIQEFKNFLAIPVPYGGPDEIASLLGARKTTSNPGRGTATSQWTIPGVGSVTNAIEALANDFTGNERRVWKLDKMTLDGEVFRGTGMKKWEKVVYDNKELVAALERHKVEDTIQDDKWEGGGKLPREGSTIFKFIMAALGV